MSLRLVSAIMTVGLLLAVLPVQAQYAHTSAGRPKAGAGNHDPEETAKAPTYKMVHGVVQGEHGALPGATVWLRGSRTIAVTNAEGEFELRVPADAKVVELTCSFGGLQEEVVRLAPVRALGSLYLLQPTSAGTSQLATR